MTAVQNLISILEDRGTNFAPGHLEYSAKVTSNPSGAPLHSLLLQKRRGAFFLVLWLNATSYVFDDLHNNVGHDPTPVTATVELSLPRSISTARTCLPGSSASPAPAGSVSGSLPLSVGGEVVVVELGD